MMEGLIVSANKHSNGRFSLLLSPFFLGYWMCIVVLAPFFSPKSCVVRLYVLREGSVRGDNRHLTQ